MLTDAQLALLTAHSYNDRRCYGPLLIEGYGQKVLILHAWLLRKHEVEAVVYDIGDHLVIAYRGTEWRSTGRSLLNWLDILRNVFAIPWRADYGWVHYGFYRGARDWVHAHLRDLPRSRPLVVVGHSMGASIAANVAQQVPLRVHRVVLFGEPRGFFSSAVRSYERIGLASKTISYLTDNDWISWVPPWGDRSVQPTCVGDGRHGIWEYVRQLARRHV